MREREQKSWAYRVRGGALTLAAIAVIAACSTDEGLPPGFDGGVVVADGASAGDAPATVNVGGNGTAGSGGTTAMPATDASTSAGSCMSDKECTPFGQLCDTARNRCVQCMSNAQCKPDERCSAGGCVLVTMCKNSLDCAGVAGGQNICDEAAGECVECAGKADCPMNHDCVGRRCVSFTPCQNSLECPQGTVCETQIGRCYECVRDADCGAARVCAGNTCRTACESDRQCTQLGLLCNVPGGFCAQCLDNDDCPEQQHCAIGQCRDDVCRPGSSVCEGNGARTCNASGSGFDPPRPCASRQTCVATGGVASCKNWACTADTIECVDRAVVTCSQDGLREIARVDCAANGQYCANGACGDRVCEPNARHCHMDDIYTCDATGLARSLYSNCADSQFCDATGAAPVCRPKLCTPNGPACNGNTATTCNANGSGYAAGGTDCTATNLVCTSGMCADVAIDTVAPTANTYLSSSLLYGNKYLVTTARTLVKVELFLRPVSATSLTWAIFEGDADSGTYTRVWTANVPVATSTVFDYYSSGDINVPLKAGKYYVIGVDGSSTVYHQYQSSPTVPQSLSFGSALGYTSGSGLSVTYSFGSASSIRLFQQRLTTTQAN